MELEPGNFQEHVEMALLLDIREYTVGASLALERPWLASAKTALAAGGDLLCSLCRWLGSADLPMDAVADHIEAAVIEAAATIVRGGRPTLAHDILIEEVVDSFLERDISPQRVTSAPSETNFWAQRLLRTRTLERDGSRWFALQWGESARGPGELSTHSCDICQIDLLPIQLRPDRITGALLHWVWQPGGEVGHPTSPLSPESVPARNLAAIDESALAQYRAVWPAGLTKYEAGDLGKAAGFFALSFDLDPGQIETLQYEFDTVFVVVHGLVRIDVEGDGFDCQAGRGMTGWSCATPRAQRSAPALPEG